MAVVQAEAADSRKMLAETLHQIGRPLFLQLEVLALWNTFAYVRHMGKKTASARIATVEEIERSSHVIRGRRVMLDSDLAIL